MKLQGIRESGGVMEKINKSPQVGDVGRHLHVGRWLLIWNLPEEQRGSHFREDGTRQGGLRWPSLFLELEV